MNYKIQLYDSNRIFLIPSALYPADSASIFQFEQFSYYPFISLSYEDSDFYVFRGKPFYLGFEMPKLSLGNASKLDLLLMPFINNSSNTLQNESQFHIHHPCLI
jgi:hypothetical protein